MSARKNCSGYHQNMAKDKTFTQSFQFISCAIVYFERFFALSTWNILLRVSLKTSTFFYQLDSDLCWLEATVWESDALKNSTCQNQVKVLTKWIFCQSITYTYRELNVKGMKSFFHCRLQIFFLLITNIIISDTRRVHLPTSSPTLSSSTNSSHTPVHLPYQFVYLSVHLPT